MIKKILSIGGVFALAASSLAPALLADGSASTLTATANSDPNSASSPASSPVTTAGSSVDLRSIPGTPVGIQPNTGYSLPLVWNQTQATIALEYDNATSQTLTIQGIQCTGDLFVVNYPSSIAANGSGTINLIYLAQPQTQSGGNVLRLLTSAGIKLITVANNRPTVATLSSTTLKWTVGETASPKSVTLSLTNGLSVTGATAMKGNQATVTSNGNGIYTITVTPQSTTSPGSFPVVIQLSQDLPNATPIITCTIGS